MTKRTICTFTLKRSNTKLYRTALLYLGNEALALDAVDESIYKALCSLKSPVAARILRQLIIRILINECYKELNDKNAAADLMSFRRQQKKLFDRLPLKEAIAKLPKDLKEVIILRYFSGYTFWWRLRKSCRFLREPRPAGSAALCRCAQIRIRRGGVKMNRREEYAKLLQELGQPVPALGRRLAESAKTKKKKLVRKAIDQFCRHMSDLRAGSQPLRANCRRLLQDSYPERIGTGCDLSPISLRGQWITNTYSRWI